MACASLASHGARNTQQTRFKRVNDIVPVGTVGHRTQSEGRENCREVQCWALRSDVLAVREEGRWLEKGKAGHGVDQTREPKAWGAMGRFGTRHDYIVGEVV